MFYMQTAGQFLFQFAQFNRLWSGLYLVLGMERSTVTSSKDVKVSLVGFSRRNLFLCSDLFTSKTWPRLEKLQLTSSAHRGQMSQNVSVLQWMPFYLNVLYLVLLLYFNSDSQESQTAFIKS